MAPLSVKAADGFLLHPAPLQAAALQWDGTAAGCGLPAAASAVLLPASATAVDATAWASSCASLATPASTATAATLQGLHHRPAAELEPSLAVAAPTLDASPTLYSVEWQAADSLGGPALAAALAAPTPALATGTLARSGRRLGALALSQAASVAAAGVVQVLHSHRLAPLKTLALHTAGGLPAAGQPTATAQPAVSAAAIAGVLKNLPFELPMLSSQLVDADATASGAAAGSDYALAAGALPASLQADLYGVAARSGALHRPQLQYGGIGSSAAAASFEGAAAGTAVITGGLGGLGLLAAGWLAGAGAPALVLLSRSGVAAAPGDAAAVTHGRALIAIAKCDVSFGEDARLLAGLARRQGQPFASILHTAGLQVLRAGWWGGWLPGACFACRPLALLASQLEQQTPPGPLLLPAGRGAAAQTVAARDAAGDCAQAGRGAERGGGGARRPAGGLAALLLGVGHRRQLGPRQLQRRQRGAGRLCRAAGGHRRRRGGGAVGRLGRRGCVAGAGRLCCGAWAAASGGAARS